MGPSLKGDRGLQGQKGIPVKQDKKGQLVKLVKEVQLVKKVNPYKMDLQVLLVRKVNPSAFVDILHKLVKTHQV